MKQPLLTTTALIGLSFLAIAVPNPAQANPEGGQVVGGSATISENGKKLDVQQHSDRAVIDWRSFNIEVDEHTEFHQPSSSATALNRINDVNPSRIAGKLSANGNIILVNPNGVFFEGSSRVDVNGIVATTANIRPKDFMAWSNRFDITGDPDAAIINEGQITAKDAGLVGLVAPHVENHGIIQARLGRVQLASGDTVTVDFYGDDLLKVAVKDENLKSQFVGNSGVLSADGGTVAMTAAAAKQTVNSLIVAEGLIEAKTIGRDKSGAIIIGAEGSNKTEKSGDAYVAVSGYLNASGRNEGEQGGTVKVLGDHIAITETAMIDTSGHSAIIPERKPNSGTATMREDKSVDNGVRTEEDFLGQDSRAGGSIKIGGDYLGKGETQTAKTVKVADGALVLNNALESGDGGRTIVWSDDTTEFSGLVLSTGGQNGGHGGFLETSGKINLKATGFADLSAQDGYSKGTYLLDPNTITIYGDADGVFDPDDIDALDGSDDLQAWLDASDTTQVELTYSNFGLGGATATGTMGGNTIITSADISADLRVGSRIRLGAAGAPATADTLGTDTYVITAIAGDTITIDGTLSATYTGDTVRRGLVSEWRDKSGNTHHFTQGTEQDMPLYGASLNGQGQAITFDNEEILSLSGADAEETFNKSGASFFTTLSRDGTGEEDFVFHTIQNNGTGDGRGGANEIHYGFRSADDSADLYYKDAGTDVSGFTGNALSSTTILSSDFVGGGNATFYDNAAVNGVIAGLPADSGAQTSINLGGHNSTNATRQNRNYDGEMGEFISYSEVLSAEERALVDQYQSVKWDIALNPLDNGDSEVDQATAHDTGAPANAATNGFNAFSTRYLERLAESADVHLQAATSITLDLDGDTLDFTGGGAAGKSLTLQTDNGNITDASAGTIRTTRTGSGAGLDGNINIITGGTGNIDLGTTNLEALNNGVVNLTSGGTTDVTQTSALNLGTVSSNGALNILSFGNIASTGAISSTTDTVDITAFNSSLNIGGAVTSGANGIELNAFTGINVTGAVNANGAGGTFDVANVTSGNVVFGNIINATDAIGINNAGGNLQLNGATTSAQNGIDLDASGAITVANDLIANNNTTGLIDINAQNDAVNPTIFIGGEIRAGNGGAAGIVFQDNAQALGSTSDISFRTNNLTLQDLDANGANITFRARNYFLNGGNSSIFNSNINNQTLTFRGFGDADNIVFGGTGGNSRLTTANLNAFDFDSFRTVAIGSNAQTGTITIESDLEASANLSVLGNTGEVTVNGSMTSTLNDGNITITSGVLNIGDNLITTTGSNGDIDINANDVITVTGTGVGLNAGTGFVDISTGGADQIITNNELTITTDDLRADDNFNGDLIWRVTGTVPTASLVASAGSNLTLEQNAAGNSIDIGSTVGTGTIGLSGALVTTLDTNFDEITFGRSDGGAVANYVASYNNNTSVLSNSTFTNEAALNMGANTFVAITTGDIILNQDIISTSATADAITLSTADDFINNVGNDALQATNSNWIVYSDDPVGNQNNGLLPDESFYNQANLAATITAKTAPTNNVFGYLTVTQPTLTFDVDDLNVEYGEALGVQSQTLNSGLVGDDTLATIGQTGAAILSNTYVIGDNANLYGGVLTGAAGTLANVLGYQYAFNAGDLTVTQADLNISVDPAFETINQDEPLPPYNLSFGPFKLADTFADLDVLPTITTPDISVVGNFPVTLSGGSDNNYNYIFTNGILEILAVVATNNDVTIPSTVEQDFSTRILGNRSNNQEFNIPSLEAGSLPDSQIDIEIEGVSDEQPELNPTEDKKRKIKLKIDKDLANQLNLQINDGVL